MTRRSAFQAMSVALAAGMARLSAQAPARGRLKQSVARWCYSKISLDDLCRQGAEMGLQGIDVVDPPDWPTIRKYGLVPTVTQGRAKIPVGWNRKENHGELEAEIKERMTAAAEAKVRTRSHFRGIEQAYPMTKATTIALSACAE